jgi:hypothetical protein
VNDKTTLNNVACGQAPDLFERELQRVLANIADDDMPATAVRTITLEFKFRPENDRSAIITTVNAKAKLAEASGVAGLMYAVNDNGELKASNSNPKQFSLADELKRKKEEGVI